MKGDFKMVQFFQTMMGKKFFEGTVPSLVRAIERLTKKKTEEEQIDELAEKIYIKNPTMNVGDAYSHAKRFISYREERKAKNKG